MAVKGFYRDSDGKVRPITPRGSRLRVHAVGYPKGQLNSAQRQRLSDSDFAIPSERKYPIHNPSHARNALARVSQHGTPEEKRKVCEAVHKRYPEIHAESCPVHPKA